MIATLLCGQADGQFFPSRNLFPLIGRQMMLYPMLAALNAQSIDRVFLTTDSPTMARLAQYHHVEILERAAELNSATLEMVVSDSYHQIVQRVGEPLEALIVLLCNAPTVTADMIDNAVARLRSDISFDAALSVSMHNEFSPRNALRLNADRLELLINNAHQKGDVYFADALIWALRPRAYFDSEPTNLRWMTDVSGAKVAPLIHEGYGDVDYQWQIPAIEDWLRRRGFSEDSTPYSRKKISAVPVHPAVTLVPRRSDVPAARRVLITTVPFGDPVRRPLDLLDAAGIEYVINPIGRRLKEQELFEMISDFGVLIAGTEPISARVMQSAPHLQLISRVGIGLDSVDLEYARQHDIGVSYTPDAPAPAVAELAVGMMFNLVRHIPLADRGMRNGVWRRFMGRRLDNMTIGVIGVGRIGKRVIKILRGGFPNIRLLANDLVPDLNFGAEYRVEWAEKEHIYREADIITLHLPRTSQTSHLITSREIDMMKNDAVLINTSRGGMVNEQDLADALRTERLGGAAIDVFETEPYSGVLSSVERCILTCHMGSMSEDCRAQMEIEATEEAIRFLQGQPLFRTVPDYEYIA